MSSSELQTNDPGSSIVLWREPEEVSSVAPEEWRPVDGHGGKYIVSSSGRVAKILKGRLSKNGYPTVCLSHAIKSKLVFVHQLVARAFHGPANGMWVHHKDNDKTHNIPGNLEYVTPQENTLRAFDDGMNFLGENHFHAKLKVDQVREIRRLCAEKGMSQREIAEMFGVSGGTVSDIHIRRIWRRVED